jgi:hypothetical protein
MNKARRRNARQTCAENPALYSVMFQIQKNNATVLQLLQRYQKYTIAGMYSNFDILCICITDGTVVSGGVNASRVRYLLWVLVFQMRPYKPSSRVYGPSLLI